MVTEPPNDENEGCQPLMLNCLGCCVVVVGAPAALKSRRGVEVNGVFWVFFAGNRVQNAQPHRTGWQMEPEPTVAGHIH